VPTMSIPDTVQSIARGEITATEVLEASIERIEASDPQINAFTGKRYDTARAQAAAVDARRARGEPLGALAGVPFAVKNLFDIAGEITLAGSTLNRLNPPASRNAVLVERLLSADAVLVGSLNMDEFAYGFTTENTHYGPTRNPHNQLLTAGGSSGGSAAAVATGQVPLTLGSDTNGSIRVPASFCGIWGLKPTFGRLSRRGSFPFVHSIDHLGPFANDLLGLAMTYDALQGVDPLDPGCFATRVERTSEALDLGTAGLRIGVLGGYFEDMATAAAREAVTIAAKALGAHGKVQQGVEWPDPAAARAAAFIVSASEGGQLHLDTLRARAQEHEPLSVDRLIAGALQPAAWYINAQRFRRLYRDKVNRLFRDWDVLLAPATPVAAPPIGAEWIDVNGQQLPCRPSIGLLTQPVSFSGCPVVTAPMWPSGTGGLPVGVQLIAAPWREDLALRAGWTLAQAGIAIVKDPVQ